jgi:Holliday junction resolvasome RuvABC endonuclease subunit
MAAVRHDRTANPKANSLRVLGMDPSFRNWGYAYALVDLDTLALTVERVEVIGTEKTKTKSVRRSSDDFQNAQTLYAALQERVQAHAPAVIFSEIPQGSQSATASRGLGIALGVLASVTRPLIQVQPLEIKLALTGNKHASKPEIILSALTKHSQALGWRYRLSKGEQLPVGEMEHAADAVGALYAGVQTPQFQELLSLLRGVDA